MAKIGRNEPCPCGSGKKYKHCCIDKNDNVVLFPGPGERSLEEALKRYQDFAESWDDSRGPVPTFNEFMGKPNMATDSIRNMNTVMAEREFGSEEEFNAFIQEFTAAQNNAPREEFLGLSPVQMRPILDGPTDWNGDIVSVNNSIKAHKLIDVPAVAQARFLLMKTGETEKGVKATQKGNLPRALVREFYERFVKEDAFYHRIPAGENDVVPLLKIKHFLRDTGLMKFQKGWYSLTKKGRVMMEDFDPLSLYLRQFRYLMDEFNWLFMTRHSDAMGFIQRSRIFCLYLLREKAGDFIPEGDLAILYMKAFPSLVEDLHPKYGETFVKSGFSHLFLENVARYLGLVESRGERDFLEYRTEYRTTDLFRELLIWKI